MIPNRFVQHLEAFLTQGAEKHGELFIEDIEQVINIPLAISRSAIM